MRAIGGTKDIMSMAHIGDPVAHGLTDRFLERLLARGHGNHLCAEALHAEDVEGLTLHVDLPHVDHSLKPEHRRGGCCSDTVLASTGLRNHPLLAHAPCKQDLAEAVIDLVRAGMGKIFTLEVDCRGIEFP